MAIVLVCLFLIADISWANPNTLSTLVGNPVTYAEMEQEMQRRYDLHNDRDIDPFILSHLDSIYTLTGRIDPNLDFAQERIAIRKALEKAMTDSGAAGLLNQLEHKTKLLNKATGKIENGVQIQLLVLKNDEKFPIFEGEEVRGHASNKYLTIFVRENELSNIPSIVGKIFHEIRARSHKPDQELKPFETINKKIELQVKTNNQVLDAVLREEIAHLEFPEDLNIMHRDYAMAEMPQENEKLSRTVIKEILTHYNLGQYMEHKEALGGYKNKAYWVKTTRGEYFLKDNRAYANQIEEMSSFEMSINHFVNGKVKERKYEWRVPYLYTAKDGKACVRIGEKAFMIYEFVWGDFANWGEQSGERLPPSMDMMAELHSVLAEYKEKIPGYARTSVNAYNELPRRIEEFTALRDALARIDVTKQSKSARKFMEGADAFISAMEKIKAKFSPENYDALSKQLVHLDFAPIHLMYKGTQPIMIVDWENANVDTRAIDFVKGMAPFHGAEGYDEFIDSVAYYQIAASRIGNPLDRKTLEALPYIHVLHRLKLAAPIANHNLMAEDVNLDWQFSQMKIFTNLSNIDFDNFPTLVEQRIEKLKDKSIHKAVRTRTASSGDIKDQLPVIATVTSNSDRSPIEATTNQIGLRIRLSLGKGNYNMVSLKTAASQFIDIDGYSKMRLKFSINELVEEQEVINRAAILKIDFKRNNQSIYATRTPDIKKGEIVVDMPDGLGQIDEIALVFEYVSSTIRKVDLQLEEMEFLPNTKATEISLNVIARRLISEAWALVESAFANITADVNTQLVAQTVNEHKGYEAIANDKIKDGKTGFIFSEIVTFGDEKDGEEAQGLGIVLPKLANKGIRVAVLLSSDPEKRERQEMMLKELNQQIDKDKPERKIRCGASVGEINSQFVDLKDERPVRFYYLKTGRESKIDGVVDSIDIIVKEILKILGRLCGIIQEGREPDKLYEAAKKFAQAA